MHRKPLWASLLCFLALPALARATPNELFLLFAEATPTELRKDVGIALEQHIANEAEPAEAITLLEAPAHEHVTTIVVPAGAKKARLKRREFQQGMAGIGRFCLKEPGPSDQLNLYALPETIQNLRYYPDSKCQVVLIGSAIFIDEHHTGWNMVTPQGYGAVPGDSSLQRGSGSPFAAGLVSLPPGTRATWLTRQTLWGAHGAQEHRQALTRFYRLWFESQGESVLARFTVSPHKAFDFTPDKSFVRIHPRADHPDMRIVGVGSVPVIPDPNPAPMEVEVVATRVRTPMAKDSNLPMEVWSRMKDSGRLKDVQLIRLRYLADSSPDTSTDLDVHLVDSDTGREVWYESPVVDGVGVLLNDMRTGTEVVGGAEVLQDNYELIRLDPEVDWSRLTVWINKFVGVDRVVGEISLMKGGEVVGSREVVFETPSGDLGADADTRGASANWLAVPLTDLLEAR